MTTSTNKLEELDTQTLKYILKNAILEKQEKAQVRIWHRPNGKNF